MESLIAEACGTRGRAVDLACGPGRHALFLAERGWSVTGIDNSAVALEMLASEATARGLHIDVVKADLESPDFQMQPAGIDLVLDCCFLHWPLFAEIETGLRPGGVLALAIPMHDDDPEVKPMNAAYLVGSREIPDRFGGWRVLHDSEHKRGPGNRKLCELVLQRPG
jgi:tellurite methyltransferase